MASSKLFREDGHDRHIRFDEYIWDIGDALAMFEGFDCVKKRHLATFKTGVGVIEAYRKITVDFTNANDTIVITVCPNAKK